METKKDEKVSLSEITSEAEGASDDCSDPHTFILGPVKVSESLVLTETL